MQQSKPLTLRRNFSWTFAGNIVYAASQWGILVMLAKLGSPEMVGQFTLGLAVTAPVLMLTNLQLRQIQATDARRQYLFGDYLGLRLIATGVALLAIGGIVVVAGYRWETSLVILTIGLAKGFESISDVFYGLIQQHERMDRIAISMIIKGPLSLLFLGIGLYLTGSVLGGAIGLVVAWAFVLVSYDIRSGALLLNTSPWVEGEQVSKLTLTANSSPINAEERLEREQGRMPHHQLPITNYQLPIQNRLQPHLHLKTLIKLVWLALPLGLVMMLISLNSSIPRYFIERYFGERELGIFAAMAYLMVLGNMVVSALGQSASPRLAKYYAAGNSKAFRALLLKLVGIGALLGGSAVLVAVVAGSEILTLLYRREYAERSDVFVLLTIAAGIGYIGSFLGYGITATRAFNYFIIPYLIATAIAVGFSWLLIPAYGLVGAAWALCASSLASCAMPIIILISINKGKNYELPSRSLD
jgi:O-antigen/teichoic acid export membrane protein